MLDVTSRTYALTLSFFASTSHDSVRENQAACVHVAGRHIVVIGISLNHTFFRDGVDGRFEVINTVHTLKIFTLEARSN